MTLQELQTFATGLDASAKVFIKDDSLLMKFLFVFVRWFNKRFMTDYATTICNRVYIPKSWLGRDLRRLLVHEVEGHVRQCRWCGLGLHPWVGFPVYLLLYGVIFFPLYLNPWRYLFERNAEMKAARWSLANGTSVDEVRQRVERFAGLVGGWDYFKPWPATWVLRGFQRAVAAVISDYTQSLAR